MKLLTLVLFVALVAASCESSQSDSAASADAAIAPLATDSSTANLLEEDNPMESVSIDVDRAGIVSLGMSVIEVYQWFDSTQVRQSPTTQSKATRTQAYTVLSPDAVPLLFFTVSPTDTITSITIQNPAYQTEKGIGVGSTFSQLSRAYHIAGIFTTKDKQVVAIVEELQKKQMLNGQEANLKVRFELGVDPTGLLLENNTVLPSSVPPDTRITRILL
jgi:hypothetical protein